MIEPTAVEKLGSARWEAREDIATVPDSDSRLRVLDVRVVADFNPQVVMSPELTPLCKVTNRTYTYLKVARAWAIKESFRAFWQCRCVEEAQAVFKNWYGWAIWKGPVFWTVKDESLRWVGFIGLGLDCQRELERRA